MDDLWLWAAEPSLPACLAWRKNKTHSHAQPDNNSAKCANMDYKNGRPKKANSLVQTIAACIGVSGSGPANATLLDTMGTVAQQVVCLRVYRHYQKPGRGGHTEASWEQLGRDI